MQPQRVSPLANAVEVPGRIVHVKSPESRFTMYCPGGRALLCKPGRYGRGNGNSRLRTPAAIVMHQSKAGGEVRRVVAGPQADVRRCAVSPDGKWVATGSHSPAPERLTNARVWDAVTGKLVKSFTRRHQRACMVQPPGTLACHGKYFRR